MCQYIPSGIKFKIFVKETKALDSPKKLNNSRKYFPVESLTGDQAKKFYEDILNESSLTTEKNSELKAKPQIKATKPVKKKNFKNTDLLWMAQNNDIRSLNIFLSQKEDFDINVVDDFGWTPLMCAASSGAEDTFAILLKNGADPYKSDRVGNTTLKLALQKNQKKIVQMLKNYGNQPEITNNNDKSMEPIKPFFCAKCKEKFTMNKSKHASSTLHLFNSKFKTSTYYGIPENSRGFQLLLQGGWDKEKGLGPNGTGRKFPVKAVMKKDKRGIGAPPDPKKNGHETPHIEKCTNKKRIYKRWEEKNFEKNFRLEFS